MVCCLVNESSARDKVETWCETAVYSRHVKEGQGVGGGIQDEYFLQSHCHDNLNPHLPASWVQNDYVTPQKVNCTCLVCMLFLWKNLMLEPATYYVTC